MDLQASVFIATSLDGYIAREDGDIEWLNAASSTAPEGEDCGYAAFMDSIDILVMGRNSYEKVRSFGEWPYGKKEVIVLSSRNLDIPEEIQDTVSSSSETPVDLCQRLSSSGTKRIYVDGGAVIQSFLRSGLITDMTITVIPILLGSGISLFGDLEKDIHLAHQTTTAYDFGFVQTTYQVQ